MAGLEPEVEPEALKKPAFCASRAFAFALTISSAVIGLRTAHSGSEFCLFCNLKSWKYYTLNH